MELHQLKYFVQVARLESVSKASEVLHVSQPALSKTIAKLEGELGCKLFDRVGKRLYLNDRGRYFLNEVENTLANLSSAASAVGAASERMGGSVRVGVFGPQAEAVHCLQLFMQAHPDVNVAFDARQHSATAYVTRDFDLVFYPESSSFSGITGIPYARNRLRLAMAATHPLAIASSVDLAQFKHDPFIFLNTTAGIYEESYRLCVANGFTPRVRAVVSSGMAQMRFVEAGLGVALVDAPSTRLHETSSASSAKRAATTQSHRVLTGGISYATVQGATPEQTLCFATRPTGLLSYAGHLLLNHALDYFGIPNTEGVVGRFDQN